MNLLNYHSMPKLGPAIQYYKILLLLKPIIQISLSKANPVDQYYLKYLILPKTITANWKYLAQPSIQSKESSKAQHSIKR